MSILSLAQSRFSVRSYSNVMVPAEKLDYILECARLAPSACNRQPWKVYVVTNPDVLSVLQGAYNRDWFKTAPMALVITALHDQSWHRPADNKDHADVDISILAEHVALAAHEQGLGTCWICNFDPQICRKALNLTSENEEPVVVMPLGYAAPDVVAPAKSRKNTDEVIVRLN